MGFRPEEIASRWREQMQRGYLKLAVLFVLTQGPLHGYQIMRRIREWTLGVITPTSGALYPTLRRLEEMGLIRGESRGERGRKVYYITEKGREVFRESVKRHFELAQSIRSWVLKGLGELNVVEEVEPPSVMMSAVRFLLLKEEASVEEKIEALERLRVGFQHMALLFNRMVEHITKRIEELRAAED
ncbi:helix-turn-helix transcriptional regulator [Candidatus Bathyarchaeota archaeon]|nr:helix-turn-helix transcriptional regulator [Candidatus Bathyarchaeota archaeon]